MCGLPASSSSNTRAESEVEADEAQGAQPSDPVTHEVVEEAAGDTELAPTCTCPNCQPSYWPLPPQQLAREDHDLAFTSTDPLTVAWRSKATSAVPNASWFPQTQAVGTDPVDMRLGTRSGNWAVSPMDPRRHLEPERVEACGYIEGLLQRQFGSHGSRANIHGGPLTDGLAHDETEEKATFWWTATVSQLPEEAPADFGYPRAGSAVTYAQLRNALDHGLDQRTMVEIGFWYTEARGEDPMSLSTALDEAAAADAEGDDEAWGGWMESNATSSSADAGPTPSLTS